MANSRFISGSGATPFEPDTPRTLLEGVTTLSTTIALPTAADPALAAIKKKHLHPSAFESISSYNWVYGPGKRLKIIVPGYPSCWNPPPLPVTLPPDTGFRMIHQNEYFSPGTPLRPMLRAVYTHRPDYEIRGVDVVTDRSSLLKLFKFVRGEVKEPPRPPRTTTTPTRGGQGAYPGRGGLLTPPTSPSWRDRHLEAGGGGMRGRGAGLGYRGGGGSLGGGVRRIGHQRMSMNPDREVRIDVDMMGGGGADGARASMLLSRWETHSAEVVPEGRFMGWGYQFLNRFTRFGDAGEEAVMDDGELQSHHRVVEYVMGGMRFLVRYHGDAITQSLAEFRFWAERERVEMRRRERKAAAVAAAAAAERKAGAAGAAAAAEREKREKREKRERKEREREKAEREKEAKAKGEGEVAVAARRKTMSPQAKKADDWLEKEFIEGLSKLTLGRVKTTIAIEAHKSLTPLYPHESIVGIKTCSEQSAPAMMLRAIPQVFFSQTPHLFIGYQRGGSFERVEKIETAALLRKWEEENEVVLKRYLVLLARIRTVVEGMEGRRATLVFVTGKENEGVKVYKRKEGTPGPVPSDLVAKWDV
ncbi:hypothetical protein DFP73DRAFT_586330 [Morchella snyderi]|nr:hypothetical protein DFP73DRAFT_586330 [Morchella snyderi]